MNSEKYCIRNQGSTDRSESVRDFKNFVGPGPVRSQIWKFFFVLVRSEISKIFPVVVRYDPRILSFAARTGPGPNRSVQDQPALVYGSLIKPPPTLVCGDFDPASTCVCGKDIQAISKEKFNIKCLGQVDRNKKTQETWEFTCPKTGLTKSFTKMQNCKQHIKRAKRFLAKDCA